MKIKKWQWIVVVFIVLTAGVVLWKRNSQTKISYKEYTVERGSLNLSILSTGTVQPENRLEIKAPVPGRIDRILVGEGTKVRKGQIIAWMSSTERAALLDAARARGAEEVQRWEEMYRPAPIIAPIAGTIILKNVEPGQTITSTEAIFVMSDRLTVKAQVDETDIAKIKMQQKAEIILDAYPDQKIEAHVDQIAYEAKTVNNVTTYIVDVLPTETPAYFRSGMTANVHFFQDQKENILLLPSEALNITDDTYTVQIKQGDQIEDRPIKVGISNGKKTEIISGLQENEIVVKAETLKGEKPKSNNPFSPFGNRRSGGSGGNRK